MPSSRSTPTPHQPPDADTQVSTLANGVRVVTIDLPHLDSVCVTVFVRSGSRHELPRQGGISHVVEHMAFKGTTSRDCQRINLDAERLGAEVNAHTDRDHTAFHMRGLAEHAGVLVAMLGDIVRHSTFPEDELERERQVILHEYTEVEDDPVSTAFKLFDRCCYGTHPAARPVIGTRANIQRFTRADLLGWVQRQYTGANVIVAVVGRIDPGAMVAAAQAAFGDMPAGTPNGLDAPTYIGGFAAKRQAGSSQVQVVLGWPLPALQQAHQAGVVAAALFGEGMSSPLLDQIRERRGLVYHAACSADVQDGSGQFVIEASTSADQLDEMFTEVARLLLAHTRHIPALDLERARNQLAVRSLGAQERPFRRLEDAAQDLFALGRVRSRAEQLDGLRAVTATQVRRAFEQMLSATPALALAGRVGRRIDAQVLGRFDAEAALAA